MPEYDEYGYHHGRRVNFYTILAHPPKQTLGWRVYRETMGWLAAAAILAGIWGAAWLVDMLFGGGQ